MNSNYGNGIYRKGQQHQIYKLLNPGLTMGAIQMSKSHIG